MKTPITILRYSHKHGENHTTHLTEDAAKGELIGIAAQFWNGIACLDGSPCAVDGCTGAPWTPDNLTDTETIDTYFAHTPDESYDLIPSEIDLADDTAVQQLIADVLGQLNAEVCGDTEADALRDLADRAGFTWTCERDHSTLWNMPGETACSACGTPRASGAADDLDQTDGTDKLAGGEESRLDLGDYARAFACVAQLDSQTRTALRQALHDHHTGQTEQAILDQVRATLAEKRSEHPAVGVMFTAMDFDEGHYITAGTAHIVYKDGVTEYVEFFPASVHDLIREFGRVSPDGVMVVNLSHDEIHLARDITAADVHERLTATISETEERFP